MVLDTTERDPLMLNLKLRPMLDFSMEDMDTDLETPVLDMPDTVMDSAMLLLTHTDTTARDPLMPSQRLRPMLDFSMEDTDMVLDSDTPVLDMDTVLDTTARDLLMLSLKPRLMLDFSMEDMDTVLDSDTPVLDMLDTAMLLPMLVLATDTVLDTTARDPLMPNP